MKKLNARGFAHHIVLMVFVVGFGIVGVYMLVTSSAARKPGGGTTQTSFVTKATEQVANQYNVGKLVKEKKVSYWQTSAVVPAPEYYVTNWRTTQAAFPAGQVGKYRVCYKFSTSKPADLIFSLAVAAPNKGGSIEQSFNQISSSNRDQAKCHDFDVTLIPSDAALYTDLRITNDATLEITESSITKL